ncbi:MAG: DNA mismatch repair endonuclease MutL [Opitutae bacterium]|nr:DNA mismatch repair endonuclease MutL [Opitutae bacterium]
MPRIKILSDRVANQIAAGEVIERPVAVIKELVENSIDAQATKISIEISNGGKSSIKISDNGIGMNEDEALLSLERHATSKLREANDLDEITSFGFRGEALPSIASVSQFTLKSRTKDSIEGIEIYINAGKLLHKKACGMPHGTVIDVRNLFTGVPARRKFLKSENTESAHIYFTVRLFALAHPQIAFELIDTGKIILKSPACNSLNDRISEIWNRNIAKDLLPISHKDENSDLQINGLIAKVGIDRSTRREMIFFVNNRPVDNRTLSYAVLDAYMGKIPKGRFPIVFLFLTINPKNIDVNIHPTKKEIRFRDEAKVRQFVLHAIHEKLEASNPHLIQKQQSTESEFPEAKPLPIIAKDLRQEESDNGENTPSNAESKKNQAIENPQQNPHLKLKPFESQNSDITPTPEPIKNLKVNWVYLRTLKEKYALYQTPEGIVLLNILRAKQRIRYEQILKDLSGSKQIKQDLIIPIQIELEPLAESALNAHLDQLNDYGFTIEPFGKNFYRILSIPNWLKIEQVKKFTLDLIDQLRTRGSYSKNPKQSIFWEQIAHSAIKDFLFNSEKEHASSLEKLPKLLFQCEEPLTNPLGKIIFFELSWNDIDKKIN